MVVKLNILFKFLPTQKKVCKKYFQKLETDCGKTTCTIYYLRIDRCRWNVNWHSLRFPKNSVQLGLVDETKKLSSNNSSISSANNCRKWKSSMLFLFKCWYNFALSTNRNDFQFSESVQIRFIVVAPVVPLYKRKLIADSF